jgi:hypothetical protein
MKTKLFAALLLSSAFIAAPAFAGGNYASEQAGGRSYNQETTYPVLAQSNTQAVPRAEVRAEQAQAETVAGNSSYNGETTYPAIGATAKSGVVVASNKGRFFGFGHHAVD